MEPRSISLATSLCVCIAFNGLLSAPAAAEGWNLPVTVSDRNAKVAFAVDSTWHMIHGTTKGISGQIRLANENDPASVEGRVSFPVARFNTENSSRDERMREVLEAEKHAEVVVEFLKLGSGCSPDALQSLPNCRTSVKSRVSIRGVSRELELPIAIKRVGESYEVTGEVRLRWPDFGVEDPSIIVARLAKEMKINYQLTLATESTAASGSDGQGIAGK